MSRASTEAAFDSAVAQAAGEWFARLGAEELSEAERQAWLHWRAAHPEHERAWLRVEAIGRRFGLFPAEAGFAALDRPKSRARREALRQCAILLAFGSAGWLGYRGLAEGDWASDHRTAVGERRDVLLADGTRLILNTDTAVAVDFGANERRVRLLRGEIHVVTAADPHPLPRPFIVDTRCGSIAPLGTRFDVRQEAEAVRVAVFEGAVELRPAAVPAAARILRAGESARFDAGGVDQPAPLDRGADAWRQGVLLADGMPLGDFLAELGRYRSGHLGCDAAVAGLRISGAFPLADTDRVLDAVARVLPVRIERFTRYWARVKPA